MKERTPAPGDARGRGTMHEGGSFWKLWEWAGWRKCKGNGLVSIETARKKRILTHRGPLQCGFLEVESGSGWVQSLRQGISLRFSDLAPAGRGWELPERSRRGDLKRPAMALEDCRILRNPRSPGEALLGPGTEGESGATGPGDPCKDRKTRENQRGMICGALWGGGVPGKGRTGAACDRLPHWQPADLASHLFGSDPLRRTA